MKTIILTMLILSSISFAKSPADFSSKFEQDMTSGLINTLKSCHDKALRTCPILVSRKSAIMLQDYLMVVLNINSALSKHGLIVSMKEVSDCVSKMEKISSVLKVKDINPRGGGSALKIHIWKQDFSWTPICIAPQEIQIDLDQLVKYDADLIYKGAPVALSLDYSNEILDIISLLKREVSAKTYETMTADVTTSSRAKVLGLFDSTSWKVDKISLPKKIVFSPR